MALTRSSLVAMRDAQAALGIPLTRIALGTTDALALAAEVAAAEAKHPALLAPAAESLSLALQAPAADELDASMVRAASLARCVDAFWEAFEGQEVDGVEIIRRRS